MSRSTHHPADAAQAFWKRQGPIFEPKRKLKVVCIGAGASGLLVAYRLQQQLDDYELEVFEKNPDVAGTWYENRYPGCACDVPSHCYTWSFEPKTDWSANYASSKEIRQYFSDFAKKYQLQRFIKLNHQVSNAVWDASSAMWKVDVQDMTNKKTISTSAHILINAAGILNAWRYPPIPGITDKYKGELVHSAAWPDNVDFKDFVKDKVVGLIGNGSSGIQILPNTAPHCKKLVTFIREPTWVAPPLGQEFTVYSQEERAKFASDRTYHLETRRQIEASMNNAFAIFHTGSEMQAGTQQYMLAEMQNKIKDQKLQELLIPKWSVGCRRITPGPNYLESLARDNVEVVYGEIASVSEKGPVMDDGNEYPVDILICATGFDTTFKPRFPLVGSDGQKLSDKWRDDPKAYLGIAASTYPNYFMTLGPNCPIGNGPVLIAIEAEVDYMMKMIARFQKENMRSFDVRPEPVDAFCAWKDEFMSNTIWTEDCRSWYKAGSVEGKVVALWPGSTMHYLETLRDVRWEDWKFEYQPGANPWAFLGDGRSSAEARNGDLSYYIRDVDDAPIDPCLKPSMWKVQDNTRDDIPGGPNVAKEDITSLFKPAAGQTKL